MKTGTYIKYIENTKNKSITWAGMIVSITPAGLFIINAENANGQFVSMAKTGHELIEVMGEGIIATMVML